MGKYLNDIVLEYQRGRSELIATLWTETRRYIAGVAKKYSAYCEFDDLIQQSYFGLVSASTHYRPENGDFLPYLGKAVGRELSRYIADTQAHGARVPAYKGALIGKMKRAAAEYERETGSRSNNYQLSKALGVSESVIMDLKTADLINAPKSINAPLTTENESDTLADIIPDTRNDIENVSRSMDHDTMAAALWDAIRALGAYDVMHMIYCENMTAREVAEKKGITESKVTEIKNRTLRILQRPTKKRKRLEHYYRDYMAGAYCKGSLSRFNSSWASEVESIALHNYATSSRPHSVK